MISCFPCKTIKAKNLYREDAKKQHTSLDFLSRALVTLAYAGVHSLLAVSMDFRIRENDGRVVSPLFRVIPCSSVANASSLQTVAHAGFNAKRLARKKNHRSIVGMGY